MAEDSVSIGFGSSNLLLLILIVAAIVALARGKMRPLLVVGGVLFVLLLTSLFVPLIAHHSPTSLGPVEWRSTAYSLSRLDFPLKIALLLLAVPAIALLFIGLLVHLARTASAKHTRPAVPPAETGEAWHETRGHRGGTGWAVFALGTLLVIGLAGLSLIGTRRVERARVAQASIERTMEMQSAEAQRQGQLANRLAAQVPTGPAPFEEVIEAYDRPRIQIEGPVPITAAAVATAEHSAAEEVGQAEEAGPAEVAPAEVEPVATATAESSVAESPNADEQGEHSAEATPDATANATNREKTIIVKFDQDMLVRLGLTFRQVDAALDRSGIWNTGGALSVERNMTLQQVTAEGPMLSSHALAQTLLTVDGQKFRVGDIATVTETSAGDTTTSGIRPAWVDAPAKQFGDNLREVIEVGEYSTPEECVNEAEKRAVVAVWDHLQSLLGRYYAAASSEAGDSGPDSRNDYRDRYYSARASLSRAGLGYDYIRREIITGHYLEEVERSFGKMYRHYTQLEFHPAVDQYLRDRWTRGEQAWRVQAVGFVAFLSLSLLGLVWGLLKVDTLTKGYYSKRLFVGVPAVIFLLVLLGLFVTAA